MSSERSVMIQNIKIGGGAPVRVESMLKSRLDDKEACMRELNDLSAAGCELVRVAYPSLELADNIRYLASSSPVPIMADIHFNHRFAISAIESDCRSIRINPGNMSGEEGLRNVIAAARANGVVIRIGANGGSVSSAQLAAARGDRGAALVLAVDEQVRAILDAGFEDIIISAKSSSVMETVRANLALAQKYPFAQHIGITEAGPGTSGAVKSSAGIALMLAQGVGDTIRVSLTGPSTNEVAVGYDILRSLELRSRGFDLISCPGCGRRRVDVFSLVERVRHLIPDDLPDGVHVAVMGCEVNGPKEAAGADIGIAGTAAGFAIFKRGRPIATGSVEELDEKLSHAFAQLKL